MNKAISRKIKSARVLIYRLYDIAYEINLPKVEEKLKEAARRLRIERRPFSKVFEFANPPVVFKLKGIEKELAGRNYRVNVYGRAYEYGVISIILEIPVAETDMRSFERLALSLVENREIDAECRAQLEQVMLILGDSIVLPNVSSFEEDYTVFFIESLEPGVADIDDFLDSYDISGLMLYEEARPLSNRIKNELMSLRFSYYKNDCVVLYWDNAFMVEPSGSMEIPDILEFANAQLIELRYYDHIMNKELEYIYGSISGKGALSVWKIKQYEELAAKVMRTVTELTGITERIDNSVKVTEDVYYARIYMSALKILKVREWEGSIRRKIGIATRVYDMLYREIANKRTELLELTIIILIIVEIIIFFFIR